ncbi:poly(U)-specific 3'-to-5' RNA exonuclease [Recurvomyces mirabilis]|uniref:U6 snRNA phosphodiesterase n=1 Tax=Recurvomyces mirabilis TaxID=574656 RepID=A0AAE0WPY7_9PEZI|nr:poly(U)-specific 3'-to-5' RNA exonuclease [Recurvomyces mirabilis]KAK5155984.1 poly(U)-specific 3'-to-5' RNA exonuclease [Recurvomyces mirabilis]
MALVGYPGSSSDEAEATTTTPPAKKRKVGGEQKKPSSLPPLPSAFRDLYSSTVRASTQDDPALHGGRKRVTPHIEGNWPAHVYLEWNPTPEEYKILSSCINQKSTNISDDGVEIHSLLQNDLGVSLPLHVSLSRPLVLKTEQKAPFLEQLKQNIITSTARTFSAKPVSLRWHPNETSTRWFLVLQLGRPPRDELAKLLAACNTVASAFDQPLLYADDEKAATPSESADDEERAGRSHISVAWSLEAQTTSGTHLTATAKQDPALSDDHSPSTSGSYAELDVAFAEMKVRIGQDVETIPLPALRRFR